MRSRNTPHINANSIDSDSFYVSKPDSNEKWRRYHKILNPQQDIHEKRKKEKPSFPVKLWKRISKQLEGYWNWYNVSFFLIFLSLICTLFAYLVFDYYASRPQIFEVLTEETRLVVPNSYLYSHVQVEDKSAQINTFLFEQYPVLRNTVLIELNETVQLESRNLKYWARHLNQGSDVFISWMFHNSVHFYIFYEFNFEEFVKSGSVQSELTNETSEGQQHFLIPKTGEYYFVFDNELETNLDGRIRFHIKAKAYDVLRAKSYFDGSFRLDFNFGENHFLVINNPSNNTSSTISFLYTTRRNVPMYILVSLEFLCGVFLAWFRYAKHRLAPTHTDSLMEIEKGSMTKHL